MISKISIFQFFFLSFLFIYPSQAFAQSDSVKYSFGTNIIESSGNYSPFWLQNKQFGTILPSATSTNLNAGIEKEFNSGMALFNYAFKANVLLQTDYKSTNIIFSELFVKAKLSVFDLIIGSRQEHIGNQDSTLSCGGMLFSHSARPIPKLTVGIEHFIAIPFTKGYAEVKGALSHGLITDNISADGAYLHHKYIYLKLGGKLPVNIQYGFDHAAQWGGTIPGLGVQPSSLNDYKSIFLGKSGGSDATLNDQLNALGNHIISQSMKMDIRVSDFRFAFYWQNIAEDSPIKLIWSTMNTTDGLWGFSVRNKNIPFVKGFVYEYMNTTDQSGPYHDKDGIIYGGADNYYNNGIYRGGWSFYSRSIATPFVSSPLYNKFGEIYFTNNRVKVHHFGLEGDIFGYQYRTMASFSKNYGNYDGTYINMIQNTSTVLEINKQYEKLKGIEIGCSIGADFGSLYGNSIGCMLSIRKSGSLFQY